MSASAFETAGLGKRFGATWALQDCTLRVPEGHVTALVGPNGAGKTTLLRLLVGLAAPSAGTVEVMGRAPDGSEEFLAGIGYLAQDVPLYRRLSADDHLALGAHLNRGGMPTGRGSAWRGCRSRWTGRSAPSRAASGRRSAWGWPWPRSPGSCSSTSRWRRSTRWPAASSSRPSARRWPTAGCR